MPDLPPTSPHRTARGSVAAAYFERLYRDDPDPWDFETSAYETAKYAATLRALPRGRYRRAFEIGCAGGVLTRALAERCAALVAVDVAEAALVHARTRCAACPGVEIARLTVPGDWPDGVFDLILVSEVGYYLSPTDLARLRDRCAETTEPSGHLVLVHWTGETDYPLTADGVHDSFLADARWISCRARRHGAYRLDVLERSRDR